MTEAETLLIEQAAARLGPKGVVTDPAEIEPWVTDWRGRVHGASPAMLAPASTDEVVEIVRLAAEHRVPLVPQGGNTGMAAGATPPGRRLGNPAVDAADEPHSLDQRREPAGCRRSGGDPRDAARRGARGRDAVPADARRARQLHDRRPHLDQRRRNAGAEVRDDARRSSPGWRRCCRTARSTTACPASRRTIAATASTSC